MAFFQALERLLFVQVQITLFSLFSILDLIRNKMKLGQVFGLVLLATFTCT